MNSGREKNRWGSMFHWLAMITMVVVAVVLLSQSPLRAEEGASSGEAAGSLGVMEYVYWAIAFTGSLVALAFAWKFLLPLSIINLFATALEVFFLRSDAGVLDTTDLWIMAGINFGVAFSCLLVFGTLIKEKVRPAGPITGATLSTGKAD